MAGALARARGYAQGGSPSVDDDEEGGEAPPLSRAEDITAPPDVAPGSGPPLSRPGATDAEGVLAAYSPFRSPEEITGAITRNQSSYDAAKQRQIDLIRAARARIPSANGVVDPQLAGYAALLSTPGNFG